MIIRGERVMHRMGMIYVKIIFFVLLVIFLSTHDIYAASTKPVEAEGFATITGGRKDLAREDALSNAFRRAVEQTVGVLVESETLVRNFELLNDRVYSKSTGYIKRYTISDERIEGDTFRIKIKAIVSSVKLEKDLDNIGLLMKKMGKPRIMLLISEQSADHDKPSYWWGGEGGFNLGVAENVIMSKFMEKGFNFVDHQVILARLKEDNRLTNNISVNLNNDTALKLATMGEAEVVIVGQAIAKAGVTVAGTNIRSCQATVSVRAVNADNSALLATFTTNAVVANINPITGGAEALKKASIEISEKLMSQILTKWTKQASGLKTVRLIVSGLSFEDVKTFKELLKNRIDEIEEIYDRSFKDSVAVLDIEVTNNAKEVAEELSEIKFKGGSLRVTSLTSNVIKLTVKRK